MMKEKTKKWIRIFFLIWVVIIFFFYYKQELIHNLDHLPSKLQEIIKIIFFIK